jgi:hypothetical protein
MSDAASPLSPNQRNLLFLLAIGAMAERTGSDAQTAQEHLDGYPMTIEGDDHDVALTVANDVLVRASRAWLTELDGYQR